MVLLCHKNLRVSYWIFSLRIIFLHCQLLHPVWVHLHGLLLSVHQKRGVPLSTALPQGIHHISQVRDNVAGTLQYTRMLRTGEYKLLYNIRILLLYNHFMSFTKSITLHSCLSVQSQQSVNRSPSKQSEITIIMHFRTYKKRRLEGITSNKSLWWQNFSKRTLFYVNNLNIFLIATITILILISLWLMGQL